MNDWWRWPDEPAVDAFLIPNWGFDIMDQQRNDRRNPYSEWGDVFSDLDAACPDTDW